MTLLPNWLMRTVRSLSVQFLVAGGLVMFVAAYTVGSWVTASIEMGVVQNFGASAALYIESLLPNQTIGQDSGAIISEDARLALREVFQVGALSDRVVTYNIWSPDGEILDSYRSSQLGRVYAPSEALLTALSGEFVSQFQTLQAQADHPDAILGVPLLEVYIPIRDARTGGVMFVVEFYQRAEALAEALTTARQDTWMLVTQIFAISGAMLFIIVHAGSRLIERQREQLQSQLDQSRRLADSNADLRRRVSLAAQRSTAQSEKIMQRIGQDLHDGVAQHLSLASLRLEGAGLPSSRDAETVTQALTSAMTELRAISRGLALPDLASLTLNECAAQAVADHNKSFGAVAALYDDSPSKIAASYPMTLCLYRFLQESLSNASRHADATEITVRLSTLAGLICAVVSDNGRGFDVTTRSDISDDGGQGLFGMSDRAETLGGQIDIKSERNKGTDISLRLPLSEEIE